MTDYLDKVREFESKATNEQARAEVLKLYTYLVRDFSNDLAFAQRDYDLGLIDDLNKRAVLTKCYDCENTLRKYLGLVPLKNIDLSVL